MENKQKVAVIGGGASGMFFAIRAAENGADVTIYEKNPKLGRKLAITGKGRCNLTNNCTPNEFISNIVSNPRFIYASAFTMPPEKLMEYFEYTLGVPLKTERGKRVFPESDKSYDIIDAMKKRLFELGVKIYFETEVTDITVSENKVTGIKCGYREHRFDKVVVATGGLSYPTTGSTGDGYKMAKRLGIKVTPPTPSLVPLVTREGDASKMQGLSLKNVEVSLVDTVTDKTVHRDFGEMMFTHFGVTGPLILSASAHMSTMEKGRYRLDIDLKPALDMKTLSDRVLSDFEKYKNKDLSNGLADLLPQKMIPVIIKRSGIAPDKKLNSITRDERKALVELLKKLSFTVLGTRPINEAIITRGGIDVSELDPKTMQSKKYEGLYFIGETVDVDAYTGGFNLQIAFSTAESAARSV